ncbi:MAG: ATP-binding protein [candidate division Zixibacteria bacterium]|nr:ATP-binding protein [candidate division Zixibacteria bacterium]
MGKPIIKGDTIKIPSDPEFLSDVDIFLEGTLRGFGAEESVVADIAISVSELVNNAMLHGNQSANDKVVTVSISRGNESVTVTISDEGCGFDPASVPDPLADENLLEEVGRGLFIVKSLMDKVDINPTEKGTTIAITKAI